MRLEVGGGGGGGKVHPYQLAFCGVLAASRLFDVQRPHRRSSIEACGKCVWVFRQPLHILIAKPNFFNRMTDLHSKKIGVTHRLSAASIFAKRSPGGPYPDRDVTNSPSVGSGTARRASLCTVAPRHWTSPTRKGEELGLVPILLWRRRHTRLAASNSLHKIRKIP